MDSLSWILENFLTHVSSALSNFFIYGFLASMAGLAFSIFLIKKGKKSNLFERSNGFWTLIAKLNYIILPVTFMLFFGFTGGVWGVHSAAEDYIEESTEPMIEYATTFLPGFNSFLRNSSTTYSSTEAAVTAYDNYLKREAAKSGKTMTTSSFSSMNVLIAEAAVESFGGKVEMVAPVIALAQIDPQNIKRNDLEILPMSLKSVCSIWMFPIYWAVFIPFFNIMMIVLGELFLYRLFFRKPADDFQFSGTFAG